MLRKLFNQWISLARGGHAQRRTLRRTTRRLELEVLESRVAPAGASIGGGVPTAGASQSGHAAVSILSMPQTTSRAYPGFQPAYTRLFTGDFNGDGFDDILGISNSGNIQVSLSNGTGFNPPTQWASWPGTWRTIVVGDFNGDHMDDIAGLKTNGTWWLGTSTGASFVTTQWGSWPASAQWVTVLTGDFTGNGTAELAGLTTTGTWWLGIPQANGLQSQRWGTWGGRWTSAVAGDFNGDGTTDVAAQNANGSWWVGVSTSATLVGQRWASWPAASTFAAIYVGDFDGDGLSDIAGLANNGTWWLGLSTQTSFHTVQSGSWVGSWMKILVGSFLGGPEDDIAGLSTSGTWQIATWNGGIFATQAEDQWPVSYPWINVKSGDFDGTGSDEVAGFGFNGDWVLGSAAAGFAPQLAISWWNGELPPYLANSPFDYGFSKGLFEDVPQSIDQTLFVNNAQTYLPFATYFEGTLSNWLTQANQQGLSNLADFQAFVTQQLWGLFQTTESYFQGLYPGLSQPQYELLMIMNLVHGHYQFGTVSTSLNADVLQLMSLQEGCCTQEALLTDRLAALMGISGAMITLNVNYHGAYGYVYAGHYFFYADGLWLDAETNTAYGINLDSVCGFTPDAAVEGGSITYARLLAYSPYQRLQALINQGLVYGFYDYYLKPDVRQQQINSGNDGGIIAFYYYHYLAGLGEGYSYVSVQNT